MPEDCTCDVFPVDCEGARIPDSHWHFLHALMELLFQKGLEATDEWILGPAETPYTTPRLQWWKNPALLPYLERNPTLTGLLRSPKGGCQAVYDWAGVRVPEALAFELHVIGWRDEVIASRMKENVPTVRQFYANALARIQAAMSLVDFAVAS